MTVGDIVGVSFHAKGEIELESPMLQIEGWPAYEEGSLEVFAVDTDGHVRQCFFAKTWNDAGIDHG